jgi:4-hydroxy-tetrahydrodipicolinate reductase
MDRKIKAVSVGVGMTGSQCAGYMTRRGVDIVGAVEIDENLIGKDVGDVAGIGSIGIVIGNNLDAALKETHPDIAIVCTRDVIEEIEPTLRTCAENGVNAITTSQEAYFPNLYDPKRTQTLDAAAKAAGVTILASGIQDVFWTNLPVALSGACHSIKKISGTNVALLDDFGATVAEEAFIGSTVAHFREATSAFGEPQDAFTTTLYVLAEKLGLHPAGVKAEYEPILAKEDRFAPIIERTIPEGDMTGYIVTTEVATEEGVPLKCAFHSKLSEPGDKSLNRWDIEGDPDINVITEEMHGEVTTTSGLINRIPDVIAAAPGFLTVNEMPVPYYHFRPLGEYIEA